MGLVFDQVLLSRDEIYRVFTGFYWVLRGFTGFYRVIGLSGKMELVFDQVSPSRDEIYQFFLYHCGYRVLPSFIGF